MLSNCNWQSHKKQEKKQCVENHWISAVNNVLHKNRMDEWRFLILASEINDTSLVYKSVQNQLVLETAGLPIDSPAAATMQRL